MISIIYTLIITFVGSCFKDWLSTSAFRKGCVVTYGITTAIMSTRYDTYDLDEMIFLSCGLMKNYLVFIQIYHLKYPSIHGKTHLYFGNINITYSSGMHCKCCQYILVRKNRKK